jgi:hypothetical protein
MEPIEEFSVPFLLGAEAAMPAINRPSLATCLIFFGGTLKETCPLLGLFVIHLAAPARPHGRRKRVALQHRLPLLI